MHFFHTSIETLNHTLYMYMYIILLFTLRFMLNKNTGKYLSQANNEYTQEGQRVRGRLREVHRSCRCGGVSLQHKERAHGPQGKVFR